MVVRLRASSRASSRSAGRRVPGRQQPDLDGAGEGVGELLVERVGADRPRARELDQERRPRPSTAFSVHLMVDWLFGVVRHAVQYAGTQQSNVKARLSTDSIRLDRKERAIDDVRSGSQPPSTVAAIIIVPFVVLALAALRYGADSRPGIDDRDQRPWLVPGPDDEHSRAGERPRPPPGSFRVPVDPGPWPGGCRQRGCSGALAVRGAHRRLRGALAGLVVGQRLGGVDVAEGRVVGHDLGHARQLHAEPLAEDGDDAVGLHLADAGQGQQPALEIRPVARVVQTAPASLP